MIHRIELGGRSIALATDGVVTCPEAGSAAVPQVRVEAAHLSVLHDMRDGEVYRTGQNSWSPSGWRCLDEAPMRIENDRRRRTADDDAWDDPVRHHSSWLAVVEDEAGALLVGCLTGGTPRLRVDRAALEALTETGRPAQWVILAGPAATVLRAYARELARSLGRRPIQAQSVWCSWYSYYEGISQEALDEEIPQVAALGFETLQIDDGWQAAVGDWRANDRFSRGMAHAAQRIRRAGMRPGLWVAPFIALPGSRLLAEHPEAFVHEADGRPAVAGSNWGSDYHALDLTHPAAQDHVRRTIERIVEDWGFTYLKLDFINAAAIPGVRHEQADREEAYRAGLRLVREAAGDEAFLLGSGAPLMPSLGILDAVRVGPDVAPMWENYATDDLSDAKARNALHAGINRLWLGEVIGVDPDVVFFRHRRNLLDDTQMQWLRDVAEASRYRCLSDRSAWLDEQERDAVRQWLAREPEELEILGRYRFRLGGRIVDLTRAIEGGASPYPL
ncbi:alpha-galactosidase [Actinomyces bowdenii]|uniref:glycoside hydrolase family 36 protein n=1 Tax=Actinomyces bowdenii TaxID=131109 RepID=UPI001ABC26DB|nr:alpha-galactosidase [Actinomyces bowdenii]